MNVISITRFLFGDSCEYKHVLINFTNLREVEGFVKSLQYYVHVPNEDKA